MLLRGCKNPQTHEVRERSQTQEITYCMTPVIGKVQERQICRDRKQISGCLGWSWEQGFHVNRNKNVLKLDSSDGRRIQ